MHPIGPHSPRVYWLRRVSVIVAAVVVLVGVGFLVVNRAKKTSSVPVSGAAAVSAAPTPTLTGVLASDSGALPAAPSSAGVHSSAAVHSSVAVPSGGVASTSKPAINTKPTTTAAKATTPAKTAPIKTTPAKTTPVKTTPGGTTGAKTAATPPAKTIPAVAPPAKTTPVKTTPVTSVKVTPTTTKATTTAPPPPSTDAQGRLLCPDAALKLVATTGAPSFAVGDQPILGVSVTNTSSVSCTRDLSGGLQVFSVYSSAGARIWSTADCFPGTGTDVRTLAPGEALQYNIKWSGTSSNPKCAGTRVQVPAGQYQVRVEIGSLKASPAAFTVT